MLTKTQPPDAIRTVALKYVIAFGVGVFFGFIDCAIAFSIYIKMLMK